MSSANWPHSGERYDDPSDSVQFVQPSVPAEGETPPPVVSPVQMPAEDTVEGRLFAAMAFIRARTADVQWDTAALKHASAREALMRIVQAATMAVQTSYAIETPEPDIDAAIVAAVRTAVTHRRRFTSVNYRTAPYSDVWKALRAKYRPDGGYGLDSWEDGYIPPDDRIADAHSKHIDSLVERGVLYATKNRQLGVTEDK